MSRSEQKVVQYLNEAHASEVALVRVLQSQIAMTPEGRFRKGLETHLKETRDHASRLQERIGELKEGSNPLLAVVGLAEAIVGQAMALAKTPADLVRGTGGEEKVLKNAKDAAATEALEIATYTALEQLATSLGDDTTASLAASIKAEEERMLARILREIPALTKAVVSADVDGEGSYDVAETGAGQAVKAAGDAVADAGAKGGDAVADAGRKADAKARKTTRQARKVPGVARAEGRVKGAVASKSDLPIARYDALTAEEIAARLPKLSQVDLAKVDTYERKNADRTTITERVSTLQGKEPWPGYDEQTAAEVQTALAAAPKTRVASALAYERAHKARAGVIKKAEAARSAKAS
jgi:ferritin-like metal-binding protein YciE